MSFFAKLLVNIHTSTRNSTSHWTRPFSPPSTKTSSFSCSTSFCCPRKKRRYSLNRIGCALIFYLTFLWVLNFLDFSTSILSNSIHSHMYTQSLEQHYSPSVSKEVEKLKSISDVEYPLDDAFENNTYENVRYFSLFVSFVVVVCLVLHYT